MAQALAAGKAAAVQGPSKGNRRAANIAGLYNGRYADAGDGESRVSDRLSLRLGQTAKKSAGQQPKKPDAPVDIAQFIQLSKGLSSSSDEDSSKKQAINLLG